MVEHALSDVGKNRWNAFPLHIAKPIIFPLATQVPMLQQSGFEGMLNAVGVRLLEFEGWATLIGHAAITNPQSGHAQKVHVGSLL